MNSNDSSQRKPLFGYGSASNKTAAPVVPAKPAAAAAVRPSLVVNKKSPNKDDDMIEIPEDDSWASSTPDESSGVDRLFNEIKMILAEADPAKWEQGGEELNASQKYPRALDVWERVFARDIPNGVLVLRSSQVTKSQFFGGGYSIVPTGGVSYTVELKPKGWNAKVMVDPYNRVQGRNEGVTQILVEGDLAETLFKHVKTTFENHHSRLRKDFEDQVKELLKNLRKRVAETPKDKWEKIETDKRLMSYVAYFDGIKVELQRTGAEPQSSTYKLMLSKESLKAKPIEGIEAKELFNTIVDVEKKTALMQLKKILDGAGLS